MRRPPLIIDRRSVASACVPLATLRPLGTPSEYTRRKRLGGSTWWRPGRAAAGGHACLGKDPAGIGRHGGAPPSPQRQGAHGWRFSEPAGARGWLSAGANEGGGVRRAAIAGHLVSGQRPGGSAAGGHACLGEDPAGVGRHGGAPPSPPAAGCPWLAFLGTRRGGRLVVCRRERRGRRAEGGNRGGRGQRARRRRRRAATCSASWGVSQ